MPRAVDEQTNINFAKGFVTETGPLGYPESAVEDMDNLVLEKNGSVRVRNGLVPADAVNKLNIPDGSVITVHEWKNAGPNFQDFLVVQVDNLLYVASIDGTTIGEDFMRPVYTTSSGEVYDLFSLDNGISLNSADNEDIALTSEQSSNYLYMTSPAFGAFYLWYLPNGTDQYRTVFEGVATSTESSIQIVPVSLKIRDFAGVNDGLEIDERPTTLSAAHKYNLRNQGWPEETRVKDDEDTSFLRDPIDYTFSRRNIYPSNADIIHLNKVEVPLDDGAQADNVLNTYDPGYLERTILGNTEAPKGHYILDFPQLNRAEISGINGIEDDVNETYYGPRAIEFYSQRVWYAGFQNTNTKSSVLFSQQLSSDTVPSFEDHLFDRQAGACYQRQDPTSETLNDLLATDGGEIKIPNAQNILKLVSFGSTLLVFAENGVWSISGTVEGFSAESYSVNKVTDASVVSENSIVLTDYSVFFWSGGEIYSISQGQVGLAAQSITANTIRSFYIDIPRRAKEDCIGHYVPEEQRVYWFYRDSDSSAISQTDKYKILIYDLNLGAFSKYSFSAPPRQSKVCLFDSLTNLVVEESQTLNSGNTEQICSVNYSVNTSLPTNAVYDPDTNQYYVVRLNEQNKEVIITVIDALNNRFVKEEVVYNWTSSSFISNVSAIDKNYLYLEGKLVIDKHNLSIFYNSDSNDNEGTYFSTSSSIYQCFTYVSDSPYELFLEGIKINREDSTTENININLSSIVSDFTGDSPNNNYFFCSILDTPVCIGIVVDNDSGGEGPFYKYKIYTVDINTGNYNIIYEQSSLVDGGAPSSVIPGEPVAAYNLDDDEFYLPYSLNYEDSSGENRLLPEKYVKFNLDGSSFSIINNNIRAVKVLEQNSSSYYFGGFSSSNSGRAYADDYYYNIDFIDSGQPYISAHADIPGGAGNIILAYNFTINESYVYGFSSLISSNYVKVVTDQYPYPLFFDLITYDYDSVSPETWHTRINYAEEEAPSYSFPEKIMLRGLVGTFNKRSNLKTTEAFNVLSGVYEVISDEQDVIVNQVTNTQTLEEKIVICAVFNDILQYFVFDTKDSGNYVDFAPKEIYDIAGVSNDEIPYVNAYLEIGDQFFGNLTRVKQPLYIFSYFEPKENYVKPVIDSSSGNPSTTVSYKDAFDFLDESGCNVKVGFDWANMSEDARISKSQKAYRRSKVRVPSYSQAPNSTVDMTQFYTEGVHPGFMYTLAQSYPSYPLNEVVTSRVKGRGHGKALNVRYENEEGKGFHLLASAYPVTSSENV